MHSGQKIVSKRSFQPVAEFVMSMILAWLAFFSGIAFTEIDSLDGVTFEGHWYGALIVPAAGVFSLFYGWLTRRRLALAATLAGWSVPPLATVSTVLLSEYGWYFDWLQSAVGIALLLCFAAAGTLGTLLGQKMRRTPDWRRLIAFLFLTITLGYYFSVALRVFVAT
jgi:hypothetical protein